MRQVYSPPSSATNWLRRLVGAALMTLTIFLVLPLTQMVSSYSKRELFISQVDLAALEAPPRVDEPPPQPPEEEPEEEPEPNLSDEPQPISLDFELDVAVGSGGAFPSGMAGLGSDQLGREIADALDVADVDKAPMLVSAVPPRYPPELRRAKVEGSVTVVFVLNEQGRVEDPRVEKSTRPEFEKPALEALKRWRFKPGMKEGAAVRTYMRQPIRFRQAG